MKNNAKILILGTIIFGIILLFSGSHNLQTYFKRDLINIVNKEPSITAPTRVGRWWPKELASALSFVPLQLTNCSLLFKPETVLPVEITAAAAKLDAEFKRVFSGFVEGYAMMYREKPIAHIRLVQLPFIRTVCETGFNAGHGTLTWLMGNPNVTVYSFDIGQHNYSRPMAEYISKLFPGRHNITWGDSTKTLPKFHEEHSEVVCDLILIDGGHSDHMARSDFDNFKRMATCNNILIYDDYPWYGYLAPTWEGKKRGGEVTELFRCGYDHPYGLTVGRYMLEKCAD